MRYDYDFRFDAPRDDMRFEKVNKDLKTYNFACYHVQNVMLRTIPQERIWVEHESSDVTYFGFSDSVSPWLIHIVARYNEFTGVLEKRIA